MKIRKFRWLGALLGFLGLFAAVPASFAQTFALPANEDSVVGRVGSYQVQTGDTFFTIARRFDLGYYQLIESNPGVNPDQPGVGTILILPSRYVLPNAPRKGIVINLSELRLYYYPPGKNEVVTFPVGVGKEGWLTTPMGDLKVIAHSKNPIWYVPDSIRKFRYQADGTMLPRAVPAGPDNPLGQYMMRLSNPSYLLHGTNRPEGIGNRSTSGCISLYPEDIKKLFYMVNNGTPVRVVNAPYKTGWAQGKLYMESHVPLTDDEKQKALNQFLQTALTQVEALMKQEAADVDWKRVLAVAKEEQGLPQVVGRKPIEQGGLVAVNAHAHEDGVEPK